MDSASVAEIVQVWGIVVSEPSAKRRKGPNNMIVHRFMKAIYKAAAIIVALVPSYSRLERLKARHRQKYGPIHRNQKDTIHAETGP